MVNKDDLFDCSFCGKPRRDVKFIVAGPGVNICDECVLLCTELIFAGKTKLLKGEEAATKTEE